jgi:ABC-2 type transport system permease protein
MKLLFLSDLLIMRKTLIRIFLILIISGAFIAYSAQDFTAAILACSVVVAYMYLMNVFTTDESYGWAQYRLTLPLVRRHVVLGRYLSIFVVTLGSFALYTLITCGIMAICQQLTLPADVAYLLSFERYPLAHFLASTLGGITVFFISAAFFLPFIMRFGLTRGSRIITILFLIGPSMLLAIFSESVFGEHALGYFEGFMQSAAPITFFIAALVLYAISALISVRLYETREL